jgi:hypothetical protein
MTINMELWQLISLLVTIIGAFFGLARMLLQGSQQNIDEKFKVVSDHLKGQDESSRRLERDLMELKAELPRDYVRREDHTQVIATIMTKLDAFQLRMEEAFRQLLNAQRKRSDQ